jgi:hypothetical protein
VIYLERVDQMPRLSRFAQQEFQLARIQPNAPAAGTIIDLYIVEFEGDHRISANGTIHIASLTTQGQRTLFQARRQKRRL